MFGRFAPLRWANPRRAIFSHFVGSPANPKVPHALEPNDHILAPAVMFGAVTASDMLRRIDDLKEYIASPQCRAILIGPDGLERQYRHYFGDFHLDKLRTFSPMRCVPRRTREDVCRAAGAAQVTFACLASDFNLKAVSLLIEAWRLVAEQHHGRLILACSNIPDTYSKLIQKTPSIKLVPKAPLSTKLKRHLLKDAHVSISLTHTDGGVNAVEGIEWGHAVVTNTNHRSCYLTSNTNGVVIDFPNAVYDLNAFGITHNNSICTGFTDYMANVTRDIAEGKYQHAVQSLATALQRYIQDRELLRTHCENSLRLAWRESVWASNSQLLGLYNKEAGLI